MTNLPPELQVVLNYLAQLDWMDVGIRVVAWFGIVWMLYLVWPRKQKPVKATLVKKGPPPLNPAMAKPAPRPPKPQTKAERRESLIEALHTEYLKSVFAYLDQAWVNESLMRAVEEEIDISESAVNDWRRSLVALAGTLSTAGKKTTSRTSPALRRALERYHDKAYAAPQSAATHAEASALASAAQFPAIDTELWHRSDRPFYAR